jgi:hypothetical protein
MRRRRLVLVLVIVAATAGCVGPFGDGEIPDDRLRAPADYDWDVDANATYTITTNGTYRAVYRLPPSASSGDSADGDANADNRTLELHRRDGLGQRRPLPNVSAVQYRYPNGTVLTGSPLEARDGQQSTTLTMPAGEGMVAYTADSPPKRFETVVFAEGSHEVILPPERRVGNPIFGHVSPPTDYPQNWTDDGRRVLRWDDVERDRISVRYYRPRDLTLFTGLVGLVLVVAAVGAAYVYRQIRQLRAEREELDVDVDLEDSGRDPPPGLR